MGRTKPFCTQQVCRAPQKLRLSDLSFHTGYRKHPKYNLLQYTTVNFYSPAAEKEKEKVAAKAIIIANRERMKMPPAEAMERKKSAEKQEKDINKSKKRTSYCGKDAIQ